MSWLSFLHDKQGQAIFEQNNQRWFRYEDLYLESCAWVDYLKSQGVVSGDRVAYLHENSIEHLLLLFACAKIGAIFVPLNFRAPKIENERTLERIKAKIFLNTLPVVQKFNDYNFKDINEEQTPLMLFTSGSTGKSKGVLLSGRMLKSNQHATVENWELKSTDTSIIETPFFHTGAYNVLCLPLLSIGAKVVLAPKFSVENFYQVSSRLTVYFGVPTMFEMIKKDDRFDTLSSTPLRFLVSGGAPCSSSLIKDFQEQGLNFKQGYGLTEVGPNCFLLPEEFSLKKVGSIGKPMPHSEVILLGDNNEPVRMPFNVGEIVLRGEHLCSGFFQDQEIFEASLVNGFYRTGDLAFFDEDGFYYIKGRKKEMYISGGENVYPREVEEVLNSFIEVDDTQIVSVPDRKWGEVGFAFVTLKSSISEEDISGRLKVELARYKHPRYLKFVDEFPLLANGKIDKRALKETALRSVDGI